MSYKWSDPYVDYATRVSQLTKVFRSCFKNNLSQLLFTLQVNKTIYASNLIRNTPEDAAWKQKSKLKILLTCTQRTAIWPCGNLKAHCMTRKPLTVGQGIRKQTLQQTPLYTRCSVDKTQLHFVHNYLVWPQQLKWYLQKSVYTFWQQQNACKSSYKTALKKGKAQWV